MNFLAPILKRVLCFLILLGLTSCGQSGSSSDIVTTIKPVHSLLLALTRHTNLKTDLLGGGINAPHSYALKPSDMKQLGNAKLIVQIGSQFERFLVKPLLSLPKNKKVISLVGIKGLTLHDTSHDHGHGHGHDDHKKGENSPKIAFPDQHIWLDPINMAVAINHLAHKLGAIFPKHKFLIRQNALKLTGELKQLDRELQKLLKPAQGKGFLVYHNAFRYFEKRYDLEQLGAITQSSHNLPGSLHIISLKKMITEKKIGCLFTEPGQQLPLVKVLIENGTLKAVPLSPLGTDLKPSPHLYFQMMRNLAQRYNHCLSGH